MEDPKPFNYKDKTIRLDPDDWDFVNENYEDIAGEEKITIHKFFLAAVKKAVRVSTPAVKEVEKPQNVQKIIDLELEIKNLEDEIKNLEAQINSQAPAENAISFENPIEIAMIDHAVDFVNSSRPANVKSYNRESLLKQFFLSQTINGPHAFIPYWTKGDIEDWKAEYEATGECPLQALREKTKTSQDTK